MSLDLLLPSEGGMVFICGKGGVGKTTFSSLLALYSSKHGRKTLLTTVDPSPHLGNVLGVKLSHDIAEVMNNLFVNEVDIDLMIKEHTENIIKLIKSTYKEIQIFNLDDYLNIIRDSPGVEEDAILNYIWNLKKLSYSVIIVDTPATSMTTRILKLPWLQSLWLNKLIDLRSKIIGYKEIIESISSGKKIHIKDPLLDELLKLNKEVEETKYLLADKSKTKILAVTTAEELPLLELYRFINSMRSVGVEVQGIVLNKYVNDELNNKYLNVIKNKYPHTPIIIVPFKHNAVGIENLSNLLNEVKVIMNE